MTMPAIDPLVRAQPAQELKIFEMMDCETGEFIDTRKFITGFRYGEIFPHRHEIRRRWKTESPKYICSDCGVPISLLAGIERNWFYFRHLFEDGRCTARTRGELSHKQISAIRYAATRESLVHILFKTLMYDCLLADEEFTDPQIETVRVSTVEKGKRRKPDVSATREGILHAFEVQLSSTFLDVILDRQSFYRNEGGILIWLLPSFDPDDHGMMADDILFSNNSNVFVLNEEVVAVSKSTGQLHFGCWYRMPFEQSEQLCAEWRYSVIPFSKLTLDFERQRVFFFDYDFEEEKVRQAIEEKKAARVAEHIVTNERERRADLVFRLENFWLEFLGYLDGANSAWRELLENGEFDAYNLPYLPYDDDELTALLNATLSAKYGKSIGWRFADIVKVGHHIYDKNKRLFVFFAISLKHYGHSDNAIALDKTGSLQAKFTQVRRTPKSERAAFAIESRYCALVDLLFPEPYQKFVVWVGADN